MRHSGHQGGEAGMSTEPGLFKLLIVDLEEYMRKGSWDGVKLMRERIYSLAYADDLVLLTEAERKMRSMMARLKRYMREK